MTQVQLNLTPSEAELLYRALYWYYLAKERSLRMPGTLEIGILLGKLRRLNI